MNFSSGIGNGERTRACAVVEPVKLKSDNVAAAAYFVNKACNCETTANLRFTGLGTAETQELDNDAKVVIGQFETA